MPGRRGNPGCYPRHLKKDGRGYKQCQASGFLRNTGELADDVRQGLVAREFADFTPGFGTWHPQDRVQLGVLNDPTPITNARPQQEPELSKQDLLISDQEIEASIREGRLPRRGF
jgi:hypothetical protein